MPSENFVRLADAVEVVNQSVFFGEPLGKPRRESIARWIAARQGLPRSYAGMFAPTQEDMAGGLRVFTGETIRSQAGTSHILGQEACRALLVLNAKKNQIKAALASATHGILKRLNESRAEGYPYGTYCCGTCSCAYWRHITAGGLDDAAGRLTSGLKELKAHRKSGGQWRCFPFYYTLLALSEIDLPAAREERRYAARTCERLLKRPALSNVYNRRRRLLMERILEKS